MSKEGPTDVGFALRQDLKPHSGPNQLALIIHTVQCVSSEFRSNVVMLGVGTIDYSPATYCVFGLYVKACGKTSIL